MAAIFICSAVPASKTPSCVELFIINLPSEKESIGKVTGPSPESRAPHFSKHLYANLPKFPWAPGIMEPLGRTSAHE